MDNESQELLLEKPSKIWRLVYVNRIWIILFVCLGSFGLYAGYLLFGNNSFEVLLRLHAQKRHLIQDAEIIEEQNARLQRQIFQLQGANLEK